MDYAKQTTEIVRLLDEGLHTQAVLTAGKTLELLYKDLYRQLLGHMLPTEREEVIRIETKIASGKAVGTFTLGNMVGLYHRAKLPPKLERYLDLTLPFMKVFKPSYVVDLRNQAAHKDTQIPEEDAWLCYVQLYKLLKETGQSVPPLASVHGPFHQADRRDQPPLFSSDDWKRYAGALSHNLELESKTFRVPVDILPNMAVEVVEQTGDQQQPGTKKEEARPWTDVARGLDEGLTVLLGDPGEGKTVCFATLARHLADELGDNPDAPLPVTVRLTFHGPPERYLVDLLAEQFRSCGLDVADASMVPRILAERSFFVLLDGLNEVVEPRPLIAELRSLMAKAPNDRYLLSTRQPLYGQVQELLPAHRAWQLERFTGEGIREFLDQYLQADLARKQKLEGWLEDEGLVEVLGTPFFLSLFARLDPSDQSSPSNRAELCQLFVQGFQERELRTQLAAPASSALWTILEEIAFHMQELHETHVPMKQFEELSKRVWFAQFHGHETTARLDETTLALLNSPFIALESGKMTFAHQLFRDFFAARALGRKIDIHDSAAFSRLVSDPWWDHTIVLLSGLLPDASPVLYNIVYEGTNYELAVRCLRESERLDLRVVQDIVEWLRQGHRFMELIHLGSLIASLPEETDVWCVDEAEALLRTVLTSDQFWGHMFFTSGRMLEASGWPISDEMIFQVANDGFQSSNATERGNSLAILAQQGQWDRLLEAVTDPSPYVRRWLADAIAGFGSQSENPDTLVQVIRQLSQDSDVEVRCAAMEPADRLADHGGAIILEIGLSDSDARVRLGALGELMTADGVWVAAARAKAVVLLADFLDKLWCDDLPSELEEDPIEQVLDALKEINTPESSDQLYIALYMDRANPWFVAEILADRGDPRAVRALVEEMLEFPERYQGNRAWRNSMQTKFNSILEHPFELSWLEALLIEERASEEVDIFAVPRPDARLALDAMVKVGKSSRSALSFLLWGLLWAYEWTDMPWRRENQLLDAAICRLIEIDPPVLMDFFEGPWTRYLELDHPRSPDKFAARLIRRASALMEALPAEKKADLLDRAERLAGKTD